MGSIKQEAKEKYRGLAGRYDRLVRAATDVRREAVGLLELAPGDVVLDIGCGTGLSFPLIEERIGSTGAIVGIDLSPEMLAKARERVSEASWQNVSTGDEEAP